VAAVVVVVAVVGVVVVGVALVVAVAPVVGAAAAGAAVAPIQRAAAASGARAAVRVARECAARNGGRTRRGVREAELDTSVHGASTGKMVVLPGRLSRPWTPWSYRNRAYTGVQFPMLWSDVVGQMLWVRCCGSDVVGQVSGATGVGWPAPVRRRRKAPDPAGSTRSTPCRCGRRRSGISPSPGGIG
jgi:hypothetical protein